MTYVGTIACADDESSVENKLHVARARSSDTRVS